jgi:hypothetical protein
LIWLLRYFSNATTEQVPVGVPQTHPPSRPC